MYVIREVFHLQPGCYKEAKALLKEAKNTHVFSRPKGSKLMMNFTGIDYRLIMEIPYPTLGHYEADLQKEMGGAGWSEWYERFKPLVRQSEREILKVIDE